MHIYSPRIILVFIVLFALLVIVSVWSMLSGDIDINWRDLPQVMNEPDSMNYAVLMQLRVPRMFLAFAVGASLSLSGVILQGIYRNPLVEPYTLGISGGASLAVAFVIVTGMTVFGALTLPIAGFIGALMSFVFVFFIGLGRRNTNVNRMLLTGVMISFVCSSLLMFLLSVSTAEDMHNIIFWTMGSLDEANEMLIQLMFWTSLCVLLVAHFFIHPLNALRLGEDEASHLGISVFSTIRILFVLTSILTGLCVSIAGIIGFVGLVIPHLMRKLVGSDYRVLLAAGFIGGGVFLMICDVLARTLIAPNELPVGVLTGITGGIVFIVLLTRNEMKWEK
jgi:iron complex transport system permease protein